MMAVASRSFLNLVFCSSSSSERERFTRTKMEKDNRMENIYRICATSNLRHH